MIILTDVYMFVKEYNHSDAWGIKSGHFRGLLIGIPETTQHCTFLDTRFHGYDERGKPRGIKPEDKIKSSGKSIENIEVLMTYSYEESVRR